MQAFACKHDAGLDKLTEMGNYNEERARVHFDGENRSVSKGPFPGTESLIAGFWIWEVKAMDDAIAWVKRCPNPMPGKSDIEIRPVFEAEAFGETMTPKLRKQNERLRTEVEKRRKA